MPDITEAGTMDLNFESGIHIDDRIVENDRRKIADAVRTDDVVSVIVSSDTVYTDSRKIP
jgi:hypothetical protein